MKDYTMQGKTLMECLKITGDAKIGYSKTQKLIQVKDYFDAELFTFEEGFCCGTYELNQVVEEVEYFEKHLEGYENKYGEYFPSYEGEYGRSEPTDAFFDIYDLAKNYVVDYVEVNDVNEVDVVWLVRK